MSRLLIVSNRLPVTIQKKTGKTYFNQSVGGLATGLGSFYKSFDGKWVGWCGITSEKIGLEEKKIIEVKNAGINKGTAAMKWISKKKWHFILAVGDDVRDEDLFRELPEFAYSLKVGLAPSRAKLRFKTQNEVIPFLKKMKNAK